MRLSSARVDWKCETSATTPFLFHSSNSYFERCGGNDITINARMEHPQKKLAHTGRGAFRKKKQNIGENPSHQKGMPVRVDI